TFFLIHPCLSKHKKILKVLFGTTGITLIIFILAIVGTIGVFGATYTQYFAWPELNAVNHVNIPYLAVEQAGLLFLIVWLTTFFVACAFYIYLVAQSLTLQFPIFKYRWTVIVVLLIIGACGLLLPNAPLVHAWFTSLRIWAMVPWVGYPVIVYFTAVLRKVGDR
ncbi:MAG TPA: GerAB/ArcD/ProY family transporter, partial [Bacillota bacterium]|nr:GerAB/ArcD/ProY family transporter [Bacillota bacterium]